MHILEIPSSAFMTRESPLTGIFQLNQALSLSKKHKLGVLSSAYIPSKYIIKKYPYEVVGNTLGILTIRSYFRKLLPMRLSNISKMANTIAVKADKYFKIYCQLNGRPDILHAHDILFGGYIAKYISEKYKIPFVLTMHSSKFFRNRIGKEENKINVEVLNSASEITAVSKYLADDIKKRYGCEISILYNAIDPKFENINSETNKNASFTFISVGSLDSNKNHQLLIKAFAEVFKGGSEKLIIAGDGPLYKYLSKLIVELGIANQVSLLGRLDREKLISYMKCSHVFALSSKHETFGVAMLEALFIGLPVISTECGGVNEMINEHNGITVENNSHASMCRGLISIRNNYDRYDANYIKSLASLKFSEKAFVMNAEAIFHKYIK